MSQVIDSPTRGAAILDLKGTNANELMGDIKIGGSLGCGGQALVECTVPRGLGMWGRVKSGP